MIYAQVIPESEYTIATIAQALVMVNLLATFTGPRRFLFESATSNSSHIVVSMIRHMPRAVQVHRSCNSIFDSRTLTILGQGSSCFWLGGDGKVLVIKLGKLSVITNGTLLSSVAPNVGYSNSNTEFCTSSVPVYINSTEGTCALNMSWESIIALKVQGAPIRTGGLGNLAIPPDRMVWVCVGKNQTTGICSTTHEVAAECFIYHESEMRWEWIGLNGPQILGLR